MPQHRILSGATRHRRRSPLRARLLSTRSSCFPAQDLHLHRLATLLVLVLGASSTVPVKAQSAAAPAQTVVRYHYGDDADGHLGWARRDFDDSSWPHRFPWPPAFASDGFLWIRARVPVPDGVAEPLALQSLASRSGPDVQELFSNGLRIGQYGKFPPQAAPPLLHHLLQPFPGHTSGVTVSP